MSEFRLEKISLKDRTITHSIDIDLSLDAKKKIEDSLCYFSLLIGVNGVGKSTILRGIIDFFIEFKEYYDSMYDSYGTEYRKSTNKHILVVGVKYQANGRVYDVWKDDNKKRFIVNGSDFLDEKVPIPHIVASCFGIFDKFPIKNTMSSFTSVH